MERNAIQFGTSHVDLTDSPISDGQIITGTPVARSTRLSGSADGSSSTYIWDCTAGRFNWHYRIDETAYVIDGSVLIKDQTGRSQTVNAGDTIFFPQARVPNGRLSGTCAKWRSCALRYLAY